MAERLVKDYIKNSKEYNFKTKYNFKEEKYVLGTIRLRPDFSLELPHIDIHVDIDPKQHKYYDGQAEYFRMYEIQKANNFKPTIFLRLNPDSYKDYKKRYLNQH
jgi:ribosomal protein L31